MTLPSLGPWVTQPCADDHGETTVICDAEGFTVAKIPSAVWDEGAALQFPQDAFNARLIRGAPNLLAALKALHACHRAFSCHDDWGVLDDEARAAAETAIAQIESASPSHPLTHRRNKSHDRQTLG
jgi:hypothetical protein